MINKFLVSALVLAPLCVQGQVTFESNPNDLNSTRQYYLPLYPVYKQDNYTPQIPLDEMYLAMKEKQHLYDERLVVLKQRAGFCQEIVEAIKGQDYTTYSNTFYSSMKTLSSYDITDDRQYYAALDWIATFQKQAWAVFSQQQDQNRR